MVVGLTVALAVVARSVTSVKISTQEEESQRAFYAAEAGLEESLLSLESSGEKTIGNASYIVNVKDASNSNNAFLFPNIVDKDETQPAWLIKHNTDGTLCAIGGCTDPVSADGRYDITRPFDICWSNSESGVTPAMEVIIIYQRLIGANEYKLARDVFDPDGGRRSSNGFNAPSPASAPNCSGYDYSQRITFSNYINPTNQHRLIVVRLRPIYSSAKIAIWGNIASLPAQGRDIESLGKAGSAQRKLKIFKAYPSFPPIFDYVLFSGTGLTK